LKKFGYSANSSPLLVSQAGYRPDWRTLFIFFATAISNLSPTKLNLGCTKKSLMYHMILKHDSSALQKKIKPVLKCSFIMVTTMEHNGTVQLFRLLLIWVLT